MFCWHVCRTFLKLLEVFRWVCLTSVDTLFLFLGQILIAWLTFQSVLTSIVLLTDETAYGERPVLSHPWHERLLEVNGIEKVTNYSPEKDFSERIPMLHFTQCLRSICLSQIQIKICSVCWSTLGREAKVVKVLVRIWKTFV